MKGRECFEKLRLEPRDIEIAPDVTLSNCGVGGRWIQYLTEDMRLAFGTGIHYEILGWYSGFRVVLHDERGGHDEVWKVLRRIAKQHSSIFSVNGDVEIAFSKPILDVYDNEARTVEDDSHALAVIEAGLREFFCVFNPFLAVVAEAKIREGEKGMRIAAQQFAIPQDICLAEEALNRFINEKIPLNLPGGLTMEPNSSDEYAVLFSHQIYRGFLDDDNVHFELMVRNHELSVELHDERRKEPDKLYRCCKKVARQHNHIFDSGWHPGGFAIRLQRSIAAGCDWKLLHSDVERDMGELWNVYGGLLKQVSERGVDSIGQMVMKPMAPISAAHTDENALFRKDIPRDTLCWVSTIQRLFSKEVIELSGPLGVRMIPGSYIIPSYQRKYTWTAQNVNLLCRDLLRAANEQKQSYHLGTIILHASKDDDGGNEFFVVDGQQRLRTISRLLSQNIFTEEANLAMEKQFTDKDEAMIWSTFRSFGEEDCEKILRMLHSSTVVCIAVNDISESFQLFSTQNGRGKPLSPENLLKAFHFHEMRRSIPSNRTPKEFDVEWEDENRQLAGPGGIDGKLLHQVIGEHLYRIRCWLRGEFPEVAFSAKDINAFKGLTVRQDSKIHERVPLQNLSLLRRKGDVNDPELAGRDGLAPYEFIDQPIVNGADFFSYVKTYIRAYKNLFGEEQDRVAALSPFYEFYKNSCLNYSRSGRRGDTYARHVFQSLCLYCYDRFGSYGLNECMKELYCCAYYERAVNTRCYYQTCGKTFAVKAVQCIADCSTVADAKDRLSELRFDILNRFDTEDDPEVAGLDVVRSVFSQEEF